VPQGRDARTGQEQHSISLGSPRGLINLGLVWLFPKHLNSSFCPGMGDVEKLTPFLQGLAPSVMLFIQKLITPWIINYSCAHN